MLDLGAKAGIVEKSGSWFSYDSQRIGQGRENAKTFLKENPEMAQAIELAIRQNAGLIADKILDDETSEEEALDAALGEESKTLGDAPAANVEPLVKPDDEPDDEPEKKPQSKSA